jgi:adenylate cyclase
MRLPRHFYTLASIVFTVLVGVLLPQVSLMEANAQIREIDSLKTLLQQPLQDTTRVKTLVLLARRLYNTNPSEMDSIAHTALRIAERSGYERGIAESLLQIGRSFVVRGRLAEGLDFIQKARPLFEEMRDTFGVSSTAHALGNIYLDQANYETALQYYLEALRLREATGDRRGIANTLNNLGILYKQQRKYTDALVYYRRSYVIEQQDNNTSGLASCLNNIGLIHQEQHEYTLATSYITQSLALERKLSRKSGIAMSLNNLGVLYDVQHQTDSALLCLREAFLLKQELDDKGGLAFTQNCISQVLRNAGRVKESVQAAQDALRRAEASRSQTHIATAAEHLAAGYKLLGEYKQALFYTDLASVTRDSLFNAERDKDLNRMESAYYLDKKQAENDLLRSNNEAQRRLLIAIGLGGCIAIAFVVFLVRMNAQKKRTNEQLHHQQALLEDQAQEIELANTALQEAHERSEQLLHNTLPAQIVERLKNGETKIAERFENVCILFADIVGFTELASRLEPVVLVALLDEIFSSFDAIAARFRLEKIKTIGDAYMLVAGVPEPHSAPAETLALAALAMQEHIMLKTDILRRMDNRLQVRIGIHAGEVIAGVIGTTKLVYDLWGDAVNIAHRMEAHGVAGEIQVSEAFVQRFDTSIWERIDDERKRIFAYPRHNKSTTSSLTTNITTSSEANSSIIDTALSFIFEERGAIEMKGKGLMKTYLLSARTNVSGE